MSLRYLPIIVAAMGFATSVSVFASNGDGSESGGGGNGYAVLVAEEAGKVTQELRRVPVGELRGVEPFQVEKAVTDTKLQAAKELTLNGVAVDAINYPDENRIVFSMLAIDRLKGTKEFTVLVLHEYLGILRINDLNYRVSLPLVDYIAANPAPISYRGGFDSIECKLFVDGRQVAGEQSSAFHGVDLSNENGIDWNAFFTSGMLNGDRRLFFRIEAIDTKTHEPIAQREIPASDRIETTLDLPDGSAKMYCWVHYRSAK